jgi:hypothetical protein
MAPKAPSSVLAIAVLALSSCAPATRGNGAPSGVAVYRTPAGSGSQMPAGGRLLGETAPLTMSEADLDAAGAFSRERASAAASGVNVLLRVEQMIAPRNDFDCAAAQPISDCPATLGAWYRVVLRSYSCDAASRALLPPVAPTRALSGS